MIKTIMVVLLMLAAPCVLAARTPAPPGWMLVTDKDDIRIYRQGDQRSRLKTFRGVARMPVDDFRAIGVLMDDYRAVAGFMHTVSEIRDVQRHAFDRRDVYVTTRLPWPVSDRDVPLRVSFYQEPDSYAVVMPMRLNPEAMPLL